MLDVDIAGGDDGVEAMNDVEDGIQIGGLGDKICKISR